MNKKIIQPENRREKERVSMKRFFLFGLVMYPFWILVILYYEAIKNFFKNDMLALVLTYFLFSLINYIFGQKKYKAYKILLFFIINLAVVAIWTTNTHEYYGPDSIYTIDIAQTVLLYSLLFPIVFFAQFATWIPFLIKFIAQNRGNFDDLKWD